MSKPGRKRGINGRWKRQCPSCRQTLPNIYFDGGPKAVCDFCRESDTKPISNTQDRNAPGSPPYDPLRVDGISRQDLPDVTTVAGNTSVATTSQRRHQATCAAAETRANGPRQSVHRPSEI